MLRSLQKILCADLEIKAFLILGHDWAKMAHLSQTDFFGKFHLNDFYLLTVPYHDAEFKKITSGFELTFQSCIVKNANKIPLLLVPPEWA